MKRKRVILHVGAPKTGSTYLQAFFSRQADSFRAAGVDYPGAESAHVVETGGTAGNVAAMLHRAGLVRQAPGTIAIASLGELWNTGCTLKIVSAARQSACGTVLFSSEGMVLLHREVLVNLYERLSVDCDPEFIMFVRDPYDCFYSAWRQLVKTGRFLGGLEEFVAYHLHGAGGSGHTLGMFKACESFFTTGVRHTLVNYDTFRNDLTGAFFRAAGIDSTLDETSPVRAGKIYNRSLSHSEALLLTIVNNAFAGSYFPTFFRHSLLGRTDYAPSVKHYYNRDIDTAIMAGCGRCIEKINEVVLGGPLRTRPREEPTGAAVIEEQDIAALIEALHAVVERKSRPLPLMQKLKHAVLVALLKNIPRDFDPEAYLFMNKDVAVSGSHPYRHYAHHGRREGRPYRYY
jgi:hypothetical protein